ncbi:hypothetical protein B5V90_20355 [Heyndrickxia sporothermodurans]|nr:hypothetical protein B5V90_20355 [Heyndrickxia sporothermodurans]
MDAAVVIEMVEGFQMDDNSDYLLVDILKHMVEKSLNIGDFEVDNYATTLDLYYLNGFPSFCICSRLHIHHIITI